MAVQLHASANRARAVAQISHYNKGTHYTDETIDLFVKHEVSPDTMGMKENNVDSSAISIYDQFLISWDVH